MSDTVMSDTLSRRPFFVLLMGIGALAMLVPAAHALVIENFAVSRAFFYASLLFLLLTLFIALATGGYGHSTASRGYLVSLLAAFLVLPVMLAVPVYEAVPRMTFLHAWFEMVSSVTTTGATLFDSPRELPPSVHLWRAFVGWLGGLLIWVSAIAILAPMNIGGFEVRATGGGTASTGAYAQIGRSADPSERLVRFSRKLVPLYAGLTGLLWLGLTIAGEVPFVALCHAMSVMATSGISPVGGIIFSPAGVWGEFVIFVFFAFAFSRLTFSRRLSGLEAKPLYRDSEFRVGVFLVTVLTGALVLRHGLVALDEGAQNSIVLGFRAFWGALFTITSFLTTTGFESANWTATRAWSGLGTPGLMLVGLSLIGGGVATTAGGIKLLRVYALWKHGQREVEVLVFPSSVGGAGTEARQIRRQGARIAWIFFMLFTISIAAVMVLLALTGVQFETAMVLAVSALSTTGPLAAIAAETPISYAGVPDMAKVILALAMVLGRLEALAIIALLNPEFWRR